MVHCERLSNGVLVAVDEPLTADERAALTAYFDAVQKELDARQAALTPEQRAEQEAGQARLRRAQERARE